MSPKEKRQRRIEPRIIRGTEGHPSLPGQGYQPRRDPGIHRRASRRCEFSYHFATIRYQDSFTRADLAYVFAQAVFEFSEAHCSHIL